MQKGVLFQKFSVQADYTSPNDMLHKKDALLCCNNGDANQSDKVPTDLAQGRYK